MSTRSAQKAPALSLRQRIKVRRIEEYIIREDLAAGIPEVHRRLAGEPAKTVRLEWVGRDGQQVRAIIEPDGHVRSVQRYALVRPHEVASAEREWQHLFLQTDVLRAL